MSALVNAAVDAAATAQTLQGEAADGLSVDPRERPSVASLYGVHMDPAPAPDPAPDPTPVQVPSAMQLLVEDVQRLAYTGSQEERAIVLLAAHPDGLTATELGGLLGTSRETGCNVVGRLRRRGWTIRSIADANPASGSPWQATYKLAAPQNKNADQWTGRREGGTDKCPH